MADTAANQATPETLDSLAGRAASGDRQAVDTFVGRISDDVYRLALRMLGHPPDAEDATQEILIKVITHLPEFRRDSGVRTWVWRIAANHVVSFRRSRREEVTFDGLDRMLDAGLAAEPTLGEGPDDPLLEEEVKLGCTHSMLLSLDRDHRLAFVLGAVLDLSGEDAAAVLGLEPAAYRKRLSRARTRMREFMERRCGLVNDEANCRCLRQVLPCAHAGVIDPHHLVYAVHPTRARREPGLRETYETLEASERYLTVLRSHPQYAAPDSLRDGLRRLLDQI